MKILFVLRNLKVGGGTTFLVRASMGLIARGHQVEVAAQNGAMKSRLEKIGVRVHLLPPTPLNRLQLWMLLKRDFDVIHACNPTAGDDIVAASRRISKRQAAFVLSIHGNLPDYVQGNICLYEANELLTFDQSALDRLNQIKGMQERHIYLMPRPVEKRDLVVGPTSPPHIVMVSRLSKTKGPTAMSAIEAVERLEAEFPGLSLTIFGDGSARESILSRGRQLNEKLGREAIQAPGSVTDPFEAMAGAAAVVGTSYVALEALFHAIPVVAAGYEGYGVVDEENLEEAIACNFGDGFPGVQPKVTPEFLVEGFERVLTHFSSTNGRAELGRMREYLEQNHSVEAVATRLEEIYKKAASSKGDAV